MSEIILEARGLLRHFRTEAEDLRVLSDLDLSLTAGESVSVTGASGSGKSTLLSLLGGLDIPDGGEILARGSSLAGLDEAGLAEYRSTFVGFVFQFHYLLKDFTALENVALPSMMRGSSRKTAEARAADILGQIGMGPRLHHIPARLSGGERQRTAIARALVNSPALVLADEPTGNLDAANAAQIGELLYSLPGHFGTAVLLATHDLPLAASADRRLHLAQGRLAPA